MKAPIIVIGLCVAALLSFGDSAFADGNDAKQLSTSDKGNVSVPHATGAHTGNASPSSPPRGIKPGQNRQTSRPGKPVPRDHERGGTRTSPVRNHDISGADAPINPQLTTGDPAHSSSSTQQSGR